MSKELDFDSANFDSQAGSLGAVRPNWMKLEKGKTKRVLLLGRKLVVEESFDLRHQTKKDDKGKPLYMGTYKALDSSKELQLDAKVLGKASFVTAALALVYMTDDSGTVNKTHFNNKVFELAWLKITPSRYRELIRLNKGLKAEHDKSIFDVDIKLTLDETRAVNFQALKIEPQTESAFLKFKDKLGLDKVVDAQVKEELQKYGISHPSEISKFLVNELTEQGWVSKLQEAGYNLSTFGVSATPSSADASLSEDEAVVVPEEEDLDLGD